MTRGASATRARNVSVRISPVDFPGARVRALWATRRNSSAAYGSRSFSTMPASVHRRRCFCRSDRMRRQPSAAMPSRPPPSPLSIPATPTPPPPRSSRSACHASTCSWRGSAVRARGTRPGSRRRSREAIGGGPGRGERGESGERRVEVRVMRARWRGWCARSVSVGPQCVGVQSRSDISFRHKVKASSRRLAGSRARQRRRTDLQLGASPTAGRLVGGFGGPSGAGAVTTEIEGEKAEVPTRLEAATEKA